MIKQQTPKGTVAFVPKCRLIVNSDGSLVVHSSFEGAAVVKMEKAMEGWTATNVRLGKQAPGTTLDFTTSEDNYQSLVFMSDTALVRGLGVSKQFVVSSKKSLPKNTKDAAVMSFITNSSRLLKLRTLQTIGKTKLASQQIDVGLLKKVVKGMDGKESGEATTAKIRESNTFMHLEPFLAGQDSNVEMPIAMDFRVLTEETQHYTIMDYVSQAGSLLALLLFILFAFFGILGFVFVLVFVGQLKALIARKYKEAAYLHQIRRRLGKFRKIHEALADRRQESDYKDVFTEIDMFLSADYEHMAFVEIERLHKKMEILDQQLPDIDDVENMLAGVRFQQPEAKKLMDK